MSRGYKSEAPAWPGRDAKPADLRGQHPDAAVGQLTLERLVDHYSNYIATLSAPPILIGHSMGGLVVQLLLQRGHGSLGIAISSAPPQGLVSLRWSFFRSNWPMLNPLHSSRKPYLMPFSHFQYTFAHTLSEAEQRRGYDEQVVPESRQGRTGHLERRRAHRLRRRHTPDAVSVGRRRPHHPGQPQPRNVHRLPARCGADRAPRVSRPHPLLHHRPTTAGPKLPTPRSTGSGDSGRVHRWRRSAQLSYWSAGCAGATV